MAGDGRKSYSEDVAESLSKKLREVLTNEDFHLLLDCVHEQNGQLRAELYKAMTALRG